MNRGEYNKQFNIILSHAIQPNRMNPFKPRGKQALLHSDNKNDRNSGNTWEQTQGEENKIKLEDDSANKENFMVEVKLELEEGEIVKRFFKNLRRRKSFVFKDKQFFKVIIVLHVIRYFSLVLGLTGK